MIAALLDILLPGDGDFPPASRLTLPLERHDRFAPALAAVLAQLPAGFATLPARARVEAVAGVEAADPVSFATLLTGVYGLYYSHPEVSAVLHRLFGHSGAPPQPLGHPLPPFDPALLTIPAARGPLYRPTPEAP